MVLPYSLAWARIHITFSIGRALVAALQATGATGLATVAFVLPSGWSSVGGPDAVAVEYQCRATGVRRYPARARWYQTRPQQRHLERVLSAGGAAVLVHCAELEEPASRSWPQPTPPVRAGTV